MINCLVAEFFVPGHYPNKLGREYPEVSILGYDDAVVVVICLDDSKVSREKSREEILVEDNFPVSRMSRIKRGLSVALIVYAIDDMLKVNFYFVVCHFGVTLCKLSAFKASVLCAIYLMPCASKSVNGQVLLEFWLFSFQRSCTFFHKMFIEYGDLILD